MMIVDDGIASGRRLSFGQERLWWLQQLNPGDVGYNLVLALEFTPDVAEPALLCALDALLARHEILRSAFAADVSGTPHQVVVDDVRMPLIRLDRRPEEDPRAVAREAIAQPFGLADGAPVRGVVVRCDDQPDVVFLVLHHILVDARSLNILAGELSVLYDAHRTGQPVTLPSLPAQFADFVTEQRHPSRAARLAADVDYWRTELDGVERLRLPTDCPRPRSSDHLGDRVGFTLSAEETSALQGFALRHRCAVPSIIAAAFQVLLSARAGQPDVTIGTVFSGRGDAALNDVVGFFTNTCALRTDVASAASGRALVRLVHAKLAAAHAHQDAPFDQVVAATRPTRELDRNPLFDVVYVHHTAEASTDDAVLGAARIRRLPSPDVAVRFDLELITAVEYGRLNGALVFRTDLFQRATIALFVDRLVHVIRRLMSDPDCPVEELDVLLPGERRRLLTEWNSTDYPVPPATLPGLFEAQVARTPDAVALEFEGAEWSYEALDAAANRLARFLIDRGVGPEDVVAVALPRSVHLVVAVLGVVKAGAAYLPIDVTYPPPRVALIVHDAEPRWGITVSQLLPTLPELGWLAIDDGDTAARIDRGDGARVTDADRVARLLPEHLAYVIFTSGSTGRPKGVAVSHVGLASMAVTHGEQLEMSPQSRVLQQASASFDAAVWELVQALLSGATLVLPAPEVVMAGRQLADVLLTRGITHATLTPTALRSLPVEPAAVGVLRTLVVAGETCPPDLVDRWSSGRRMLNAYGPTETTVCATVSAPLSAGAGAPIGRPVRNTRIYVLDGRLCLVPTGVAGEVYVAGAGVARGYLGQAGLTGERFVANPYGPPGSRMYRTGDLARWRSDGALEYVGRVDEQVKVRGFRIEPREIEVVLEQLPSVAGVAVVVRDEDRGDRRLVAYVVPATRDAVAPAELRVHASQRLPDYLVPSTFMLLDELPLTSSGKLDRQALPEPESAVSASSRGPRTLREQILCGLFAEVLGLPQVGVDDAFFDLGGHSLLAMRLVSRIRTELQVDASIRTLFEAPTVTALARSLDAGPADAFATLLPLRMAGDGVPVFFVHPIGGLSWCYARFLPHIARHHPVYGLQASGYLERADRPGTLDEVIAEYVTQIRRTHPHGPYALAGWSLGGFMAHEIAVDLERRGESVPVVFMLDAAPAQRDDGTDAAPPPEDVRRAIAVSIQGAAGGMTEAITNSTMADLTAIAEHYVRLTAGYGSSVFSGRVVSIEASGSAAARDASRPPWSEYARGGVDRHIVECGHAEVMAPETVSQTGPILAEALGRRLGAHVPEGPVHTAEGGDESA